jgi:hypothetical protein
VNVFESYGIVTCHFTNFWFWPFDRDGLPRSPHL